jgi:hypothetical protein
LAKVDGNHVALSTGRKYDLEGRITLLVLQDFDSTDYFAVIFDFGRDIFKRRIRQRLYLDRESLATDKVIKIHLQFA